MFMAQTNENVLLVLSHQ